MEVGVGDVRNAAELIGYFEATARKAFCELASSDTALKNAFEVYKLLESQGGVWTATADEWRQALPSAPDTPEATSKLLRKIVGTTPRLVLEDGYRGKERAIKISLLEKTVGTVGEEPAENPINTEAERKNGGNSEDPKRKNAENSENGRPELKHQETALAVMRNLLARKAERCKVNPEEANRIHPGDWQDVATDRGMSKREFKSALADLEEAGRVEYTAPDGIWATSYYTLATPLPGMEDEE